jgi:hypothetical protein
MLLSLTELEFLQLCFQIGMVKDSFKVVHKSIKETFDNLEQLVQRRRRELEQEARTTEDTLMAAVKKKDTTRASLASNANTVEQLVASAPPPALLAMVGDVSMRLDRVEKDSSAAFSEHLKMLKFTQDSQQLSQLQASILTVGM